MGSTWVKPGACRETLSSSQRRSYLREETYLFLRLGTHFEGVVSEGCGAEGSLLVCRQHAALDECSSLTDLRLAGSRGLAWPALGDRRARWAPRLPPVGYRGAQRCCRCLAGRRVRRLPAGTLLCMELEGTTHLVSNKITSVSETVSSLFARSCLTVGDLRPGNLRTE